MPLDKEIVYRVGYSMRLRVWSGTEWSSRGQNRRSIIEQGWGYREVKCISMGEWREGLRGSDAAADAPVRVALDGNASTSLTISGPAVYTARVEGSDFW